MGYYPAYKLRDVLDMYAITFFTLLNDGYKRQSKHYLMLANIFATSQSDKPEARQFLKQLEWATKDMGDILIPSSDGGDDPQQLKRLLGG